MWINGDQQWDTHVIGKKHRRNTTLAAHAQLSFFQRPDLLGTAHCSVSLADAVHSLPGSELQDHPVGTCRLTPVAFGSAGSLHNMAGQAPSAVPASTL
eukprot:5504836-Lingulodinium_polyedra.AAC.1